MDGLEWARGFLGRVVEPFEQLGSVCVVRMSVKDWMDVRVYAREFYSPYINGVEKGMPQGVGAMFGFDLVVCRWFEPGRFEVDWVVAGSGSRTGCVHPGGPAVPSEDCGDPECVVRRVLES